MNVRRNDRCSHYRELKLFSWPRGLTVVLLAFLGYHLAGAAMPSPRSSVLAIGLLLIAGQDPDRNPDSTLCDRSLSRATSGAAREELGAAISEAQSANQSARVEFLRGCEQWSNGHDDRAAAQFEKAAKLEPTSAIYQFWLGQVYGAQAEKANVFRQPSLAKRVKEHFERAVAIDTNYLAARNGLVQYYLGARFPRWECGQGARPGGRDREAQFVPWGFRFRRHRTA